MLLSEPVSLPLGELRQDSGVMQAARRVFSFPVVIAALLVVLAVMTVRARLNDPDMWWHLKIGQIIWDTHQIPTTDIFSFTTNNHAYIPHEWLAEVAIYAAYRWGGYTGLMIWLCLATSLIFVAAYTLSSCYSGNSKVALLGALVTWMFATVGLAIRPHMIAYFLLVCELLLLHLGRHRDPRWLLILPLIFAVWVNCHGSFILGVAVLLLFLGCSFVDFRVGLLVCTRWAAGRRTMLALASALSVAALLLNPVGLKQITYPLDVMTGLSTDLSVVAEWQPPSFNETRDYALLGVAGLILFIPLVRKTDLRLQELLLVGAGFLVAIRHTRMMFVFGILAAPILCRLLADTWERYEAARDRLLPNIVMLALVICTIGLAFPGGKELNRQVQQGNPAKAVQYIQTSGLSGRMLNEYGDGFYLIWFAPGHKVFIDGRTDIFDWTGVLGEYAAWATLKQDPKILLDKYAIDFCLLSIASPLSRVLPYLPGWKAIYSDEVSIIFARVH